MEGPQQTPPVSAYESIRNLQVGEFLEIGGEKYEIEKVEQASDIAPAFGLKIDRHVPVYYLKGTSKRAQGGYSPQADIIVIFQNMTDRSTLEHELIHAVEYQKVPTSELLALYERAKELITEDSFEDGFVTFNHRKNIHEFIADGRTKLASVLKKVGLWDDFVKETQYIFE